MQGLPSDRHGGSSSRIDLDLFSRGGLKILDKIEQQNYNVLLRGPKISKIERVAPAVVAASSGRSSNDGRWPHDDELERSYQHCRRSRARRRKTSTIPLSCSASLNAMRCARSMRSCAIVTI